ncbi:MAG: hypothetical protein AAB631_00810 [Patescibacteria group bacterium]
MRCKSSLWILIIGLSTLFLLWFLTGCGDTDKKVDRVTKEGNKSAVEPGQVLDRTQQEAVLELIRREHEIGGLRQTRKQLEDLHLKLLHLRISCFSSAPPQIRNMIDSVLIFARQTIDSNVVLTDGFKSYRGVY